MARECGSGPVRCSSTVTSTPRCSSRAAMKQPHRAAADDYDVGHAPAPALRPRPCSRISRFRNGERGRTVQPGGAAARNSAGCSCAGSRSGRPAGCRSRGNGKAPAIEQRIGGRAAAEVVVDNSCRCSGRRTPPGTPASPSDRRWCSTWLDTTTSKLAAFVEQLGRRLPPEGHAGAPVRGARRMRQARGSGSMAVTSSRSPSRAAQRASSTATSPPPQPMSSRVVPDSGGQQRPEHAAGRCPASRILRG